MIADGLRFVSTANNQPSTSGVYYYHNNHLGTPQILTAENQQIVWQASYTPYGLAEISSELVINNIRLPGQYFDAETGLYYNYFRYYDPKIGRYMTSDPIGLEGGINTFGYVGGNPVGRVDPDGLNPTLAGEAGWFFGRVTARPAANWVVRQMTGNATATVGTWAYDAMHAEEAEGNNEQDKAATAERKRYHKICDKRPPKYLDQCQKVKWARKQAQYCYDARKAYTDKWDKVGSNGWKVHKGQLQQVKNRIKNAVDSIQMHCINRCN